jgi:hypothetical protein
MFYATSASWIRAVLARWTIPLMLSLTIHSLIIHQLSLLGLAEKTQALEDSAELRQLDGRVVVLERSNLRALDPREYVSQADLTQLADALTIRMSDLSKKIGAAATNADLQSLQHQTQAFELQLKHPSVSQPVIKPRRKILITPKPAVLGFQIIGRELRGNERFLSIAPIGAQSLEQSHLLRIGETYDGWRLDGFDEQSAVFLGNGQTRRLSMP